MNSSLVIEEHRFRSEFLWLTVRLNVDTGACATKQKRSPARWPFVFIKSYYPPCKNFNARGQANIFKPPLCTKRFSFAFSLSLSSSLTLSLSLSPSLFHFYLFVRCVAATGRGAQLPGMTLRIGCFDGITYPHEITIRHFARTRSSVIPFARCLFARKMVKNWARKVYLLFLLAFGFSARAEFYSIINKATAVGAKRLIIFSFCPFFLVFSKEVFSAIIKRKLRRFILTFMRR